MDFTLKSESEKKICAVMTRAWSRLLFCRERPPAEWIRQWKWLTPSPRRLQGKGLFWVRGKGNRAQAYRLNVALSHFLSSLHIHSSARKYDFAASTTERNDPNISSHPHGFKVPVVCVCVKRCLSVGGGNISSHLICTYAVKHADMQKSYLISSVDASSFCLKPLVVLHCFGKALFNT